jgi:hypothetical protein
VIQLSIPMPVQPRAAHRMSDELYRDILLLRRRGLRVYRAGQGVALVDGLHLTFEQLRVLARTWRKSNQLTEESADARQP